jgi:hypothetical protein
MKNCKRGHPKSKNNTYTNSTCKICHSMLKRTGRPKGKQPLPEGEASFNRLHRNYQDGAYKRGLVFKLSKVEFKDLTKGTCVYCGLPPSQVYKARTSTPYIYNGVDRKNNKVGYTKKNSVSCCKQCNTAKLSLPLNLFMEWIDRLTTFNLKVRAYSKHRGRN